MLCKIFRQLLPNYSRYAANLNMNAIRFFFTHSVCARDSATRCCSMRKATLISLVCVIFIAMAKLSLKSLALKWYFFCCPASANLYSEYFSLFMKQLGFNSAQIGLTALFGLPQLLIPLFLLFGEKLRARNVVAVFGTLGTAVCCSLPLVAIMIPEMKPICRTEANVVKSNDSLKVIQDGMLQYASSRPNYVNYVSTNRSDAIKTHTFFPYSSQNVTLIAPSTTAVYPSSSYTSDKTQLLAKMPHNMLYLRKEAPQQAATAYHKLTYSTDSKRKVTQNRKWEIVKGLGSIHLHSAVSMKTRQSMNYLPTNSQSQSTQHSTLGTNLLHSKNSFEIKNVSSNVIHDQSFASALLPLLILSRSLVVFFDRIILVQGNLATITYLNNEKESYGSFFMWVHIGSALSTLSTALFAVWEKINICGIEKYGYFIAFILGSIMALLSTLSLPWFEFEYNQKKNFNWSSVKSDVLNAHYIFMFMVLFYNGLCSTFQIYWEFWYLDGLSATPLLIAGAVLVRRPIVAMSTFVSGYLIRKIGDLKMVCVALFLYSMSFLALSFTRKPYLVLIIDTLQGAAFGFGYCAFTVHFYKASSKENSSMILGKKWSVAKSAL